MARNPDHQAGGAEAGDTSGLLGSFLAEEEDLDRGALWRLASWGVAAIGAVIIAVLANQSSIGLRRDQIASVDLTRQSLQIQSVAKESQNEARRLASAIETLNGDRDRLYSRVTVLEQGLDSVTGTIARQSPPAPSPQAANTPPVATTNAAPSQNPSPVPVVAPPATTATAAPEKSRPNAAAVEPAPVPVASLPPGPSSTPANTPAATPSVPLVSAKSMMGPPDSAATKLIEPEVRANPKVITAAPIPEVVTASTAAEIEADALMPSQSTVAVPRTEFGVDIGGANSFNGLRALWRDLHRSSPTLAALRPMVMVKEGGKSGVQLRLVAGPLGDAAAAAAICATLTESRKACETTVFGGQRLATKTDDPPVVAKPFVRKRNNNARRTTVEEPPKKPESTTISTMFGRGDR